MAVNLINSNDIEVEQTGQDIQLKTSTPISTIEGYIGDLTLLNTTDKSSLVNAVNEVNQINSLLPIDITDKFESVAGSKQSLQAMYFPGTKMVVISFWITSITASSGWTNIIRIKDSTYYSKYSIYSAAYSTDAGHGAVGLDANSEYIKGFQKTIFGTTIMYEIN